MNIKIYTLCTFFLCNNNNNNNNNKENNNVIIIIMIIRKNRSHLQKECKTISVAGLISYMEKKTVGAPKVKTWV